MCLPAARLTDLHTCPRATGVVPHVGGPVAGPCMPTVLIGGMPAARVTDLASCVGPPDAIATGAPKVLIGGLPAARMTDQTAHGGVIVVGYPTVLICATTEAVGDLGGSEAGAMAGALAGAADAGAPFCEVCGA